MSEIEDVVDQHRKSLRANEAESLKRLAEDYTKILNVIQVEIDALELELQALVDAGEIVNPSLIYRLERYALLQNTAKSELGKYAVDTLDPVIKQMIEDAVEAGSEHAQQLILQGFANGPPDVSINLAGLPTQATENIIATTAEGPLARLLTTFGDLEAERMRQSLITGLATGRHPYQIARGLRDAANIPFTRAATIARTETLRAYRQAHSDVYKNNRHLLKGWVWSCSKSDRTCSACWSMEGRTFDVDEPMMSHVNCRCTQIPKTKTWTELGFNVSPENESSYTAPLGEDVFSQQSDALKLKVLGPSKFAAYRDGQILLEDTVGLTTSSQWGTSATTVSLPTALQNAERRQRTSP